MGPKGDCLGGGTTLIRCCLWDIIREHAGTATFNSFDAATVCDCLDTLAVTLEISVTGWGFWKSWLKFEFSCDSLRKLSSLNSMAIELGL